jgi:CheY-like chemotaxis protein
MRILLVDDEPGIREGLAALLRKQGHEVRTAADCAAATAALVNAADFDVVVTDWRLPDGLAASFAPSCPCPVIAVSGHPEEIAATAAIREVLTKPVTPKRLLAALHAVTGTNTVTPASAPAPVAVTLPADVREVVDQFHAALPAGTDVRLHDDGTFVTVVATVAMANGSPVPPALPTVAGGELRCRARAGKWLLELRLCRDGRPDAGVPVVPANATWPAAAAAADRSPHAPEFAVDFHDSALAAADFLACVDRATRVRRDGGRVHFLNVPPALAAVAASHGRAHDMPMRAPVGPRLQAHFADLWS